MCSNIPSWLISPVGLIKEAAKTVGVNDKLATGLTEYTDPISIIANKKYKKEQKEQHRDDKAWERYYASQKPKAAPPASPFTSYSSPSSPGQGF